MVKHGFFDLCWMSESSIINNSAARSGGFELRDTWNELVAVQRVINPVSRPDSYNLFQNQPQFMTTTLIFPPCNTRSVNLDNVQGTDDMDNSTSDVLLWFHSTVLIPSKHLACGQFATDATLALCGIVPSRWLYKLEELILHFMMSEQHKGADVVFHPPFIVPPSSANIAFC